MKSFLALCVLAIFTAACGGDSNPVIPTPLNVPFSTTTLREGTGPQAVNGNSMSVTYTLWLYSTTATDNKGPQLDAGSFTMTLGVTNLIPGFTQGVTGMRQGELRRIVVPPNLAYGSAGQGSVPPNATLVFEVNLVTLTQ